MIEPAFPTLEGVLVLHDRVVAAHGGLVGVRDENLLHSALARAENKRAYGEPGSLDVFDLAAAYAFGIAKNHPFNDGNKRTAWGACALFLTMNGAAVQAGPELETEQMVALAEGAVDEAAFAAWLRSLAG